MFSLSFCWNTLFGQVWSFRMFEAKIEMLDTVIFLGKSYRFTFLTAEQNSNKVHRFLPVRRIEYKHRISWILMSSHIVLIFAFVYCITQTFHTIEWPCLNMNDCAVWLISWNHITVAILIQLSALTYRRRETLSCLDEAEGLAFLCAQKQRKSRVKLLHYFVCLILIVTAKIIVALYTQQVREIFIFILFNTTLVPPLSVECLVMLLSSIVGDVCDEINDILAKLSVDENMNIVERTQRLKKLMDDHQKAANFFKNISRCFSEDLLVDLAFNMIWFIICIYVTTVALYKREYDSKKKIFLMLDLIFLSSRVFYFSFSASRIEKKVQRMVIELRNLLCLNLNSSGLELAQRFMHQVIDNEMKIDVSGLFYVNMSFMRAVISLATTYLIVFIQYGFSDRSPSSTNSSVPSSTTPPTL